MNTKEDSIGKVEQPVINSMPNYVHVADERFVVVGANFEMIGDTLWVKLKYKKPLRNKSIEKREVELPKDNNEIEEVINAFIKKWCGENIAHLLDNDENDGEKLRTTLTTYIKKARIDELETIYKKIDTGNVYLGLGKIKSRIKELQQSMGGDR